MSKFTNLIKTIGDRITAKSYTGLLSGGFPVNANQWNGTDYLRALDISLYTNRAIEKRSEKVGEIQFVLRDKKGDIIKQGDPLIDLLYAPNKVFTGYEFWSLYQKYYDAIGEVYIWIERGSPEFGSKSKINGLHLLIPTLVTPVQGKDGLIVEYKYVTGETTTIYPADQIIYRRNPDPKKPLRGQSLLKAGVNAIQTESQISTYHSRVLENGGKVEGIFSFKTPNLSVTQLEGLKDGYKKEYGSAKKSGTPLFLGGDATYTKTGLTPDELSYLEAKKMTLEDICILTGVPKALLASMDGIQYANAETSVRIFLRETIRPLLKGLTVSLDIALFPDDRTLDFIDPTPENIDEKIKETESGIKNYYMTINEARSRHGMDPVEGGDDILVPGSVGVLGADPSVAPAPTKMSRLGEVKKVVKNPLRDADFRKLYADVQVKRMDAREKSFNSALKEYLAGQEKRITGVLEQQKGQWKKKGFDEYFNPTLEVTIGKTMFIPILTEMLKNAGIDAIEFTGSSYDFNLGAELHSWVQNRADVFLTKINETTFKQLQSDFKDSVEAEEGREKLIKRIQTTYDGITKGRAGMIARTEVHNATQNGTLAGYKQGGLTTKIWVSVMDEYTRDSHASVDGEEVPIDMAFSNGLMMPGDGGPEDSINCRCVI